MNIQRGYTAYQTERKQTARFTLTVALSPDEGGANFLRNVGSYKSHTAYHPRKGHSSYSLQFSRQQNIFPEDGVRKLYRKVLNIYPSALSIISKRQ
jgi:hypothetical protein